MPRRKSPKPPQERSTPLVEKLHPVTVSVTAPYIDGTDTTRPPVREPSLAARRFIRWMQDHGTTIRPTIDEARPLATEKFGVKKPEFEAIWAQLPDTLKALRKRPKGGGGIRKRRELQP
jgi:hypothetical protein